MRRLQLGALLLAMAVLSSCGGGDGGDPAEDALRRMVLQPEDLPEVFAQADETLITNEKLAASTADPEETKTLLEKWARLLGYEVTYGPTGEGEEDSPVNGINAAANLYRTEEGAGESFADAAKTAEEADWTANYAGLRDFQQEKIDVDSPADEIIWLRFSGFQPTDSESDALITDNLIFFREGRVRGFLRVQANFAETEDRGHYQSTVEGWLRAMVGNVKDVLPELEDGE